MAGCLCSSALALGADRTAEQVLKEIDAIKTPAADSKKTESSPPVKENQSKTAQGRPETGRLDRRALQDRSRPQAYCPS